MSADQLKIQHPDNQTTFFSSKKNPALCKTSPPLLTRFYSTISSKSDSSPSRESAQPFVHAVHILCLDHDNSQAPKTAATILPGILLPFSPSHSTNLSGVTPSRSLPPQASWGCFYQIQKPHIQGWEGISMLLQLQKGVSPPMYLKTNLFKTSLTSSSCYWISSIQHSPITPSRFIEL